MKTLLCILTFLTALSCYSKQKAQPFEPYTEKHRVFRWMTNWYLENNADCAILIDPFGSGQIGISFCADGDSIVYKFYAKPFLKWQIEAQKAQKENKTYITPKEWRYKLSPDSISFNSICSFIDSIVKNAVVLNDPPSLDGTNWYLMSHGKWAYMHTDKFPCDGEITGVLGKIAGALENDNVSELSPNYLGISEYDCFQSDQSHHNWVDSTPYYTGGWGEFHKDICKYFQFPNDDCVRGTIVLKLLIKRDGSIDEDRIEVVRQFDPEYSKQFIECIKHLDGFNPTLFFGEPVESWITVPIRFNTMVQDALDRSK